MGIIVDPVTKKLPHPRPKMVLSRINVLNPRAGPENAGMHLLRNLKTPLNTMACCEGMMYAQLYGYCSWLSKFSLCHPLLHLTRIGRLCLMSQAICIKHPQHSLLYSVSLIRLQGKKVVSSTVILVMLGAWHLPSTAVSIFTVAQLSCQLN